MLSLRHSIGNASPLESLARNSTSVPHLCCYATSPPTESCAPSDLAGQGAGGIAARSHAKVVLGEFATKSTFKERVRDCGFVHISATFTPNKLNPFLSSLALRRDEENDGLLEVREVYGLELARTSLVTIPLWRQGTGILNHVEGMSHFSHAFLVAGVPSVVTNLWQIDDRAEFVFMEAFYGSLNKTGIEVAQALQQTQRTLRSQHKYSHPYYWASFVLTGIPYLDPIPIASPFLSSRVIGVSAVISSLLFFSYLFFFVARPNHISIRTAFLLIVYPRQLVLAAGGGYIENNWDSWQQRIEDEITANGMVSESTLSSVPTFFRSYAMQRYQREHEEMEIAYESTSQFIKYIHEDLLRSFNRTWDDIKRKLIDGENPFSEIMKLSQQFSELVNIPIHVTYGDNSGDLPYFLLDTSLIFQDLKLLEKLPLIVLNRLELADVDMDNIRHILTNSQDPSRRIALLFLFLDIDGIDEAKRRIDQKLRQSYACDVIVFHRAAILQIILQRNRHRALRRVVLENADLRTLSPFTTTGPVPNHAFFGREYELREITERVDSVTYVVIGGRRIGKSSLLTRLHQVRLPAASFRSLYYDCSTTPTSKAFLAAGLRDWSPDKPSNTPATFGELLQSPPSDKPLVLLLDEADKLVPTDHAEEWPLFRLLRSLANSGLVHIVLSGEHTLRDALQDPSSPLFNFAHEMLIGCLDYRAVEELVTRPMRQLELDLIDEQAIVKRIWDFTSGHPNIVQRLCHRLIERLNQQGSRRLTLDDVNAVIENPHFQERDFLQTYWEGGSILEKIVTLILARNARVYSLTETLQFLETQAGIQPSAAATKDALDRLVDLRSILKRSQRGYSFAVEAFPLILANTSTPEDLLEVFVEQYRQMEQSV